ncbi:MAG: hypothetical protein Q8Q38_00605 [bacterium]|nr:hypothetical protein [bacterium]MDZ4231653.1 hypothetical protein [Candidatus Pacearchaeota archaeon]
MDFTPYLQILWDLVKDWWWLALPVVLYKPTVFLWLWWRQEMWINQQRMIVLEITPPREVVKPIRAMENVFSALWQVHDPPNPREKWFEGKVQMSISLEIVSDGGKVHFYIRCPEGNRNLIESSLYSEYPSIEIAEVEDYIKQVPPDIPNKEWDLWGTNYKLQKPDPYPIKTYKYFFEESEGSKEEERVDPLSNLVEGLSHFRKGEKLWLQIVITPILNSERNYVAEGKAIVDKLVKRPDPKKGPTVFSDLEAVSAHLATGIPKTQMAEEVREFIPPEMKLTPGERLTVAAIEEKVGKYAFHAVPRFIYLAPRDNYYSPSKAIAMSYFSQMSTADLNGFGPLRPTLTKVHTILTWFLDRRRVYIRKRRLLRNYVRRLPPFFPVNTLKGTILLNIEELATMFHFPGQIVAPGAGWPRVETKKGGAPRELPMEEE